MSEYYTNLAEQAGAMSAPGIPVASAPGLHFGETVASLKENIQVDFELLINVAAGHDKDPSQLRSLGISLVGAEECGLTNGALLDEPAILGDKVHYPVIQLTVPEELPPQPEQFVEKVNHTSRHEFYPVLQEGEGWTLYQSRMLRAAVTAGGAALAFLGMKLGYDAVTDGPFVLGAAGVPALLGGGALMVDPRAPLWYASAPERDAERFARIHPALKPLSLV